MIDTKIKIQNMRTEKFEITQGRRQGDELAPILFNITLNKVEKNIYKGINIMQRQTNSSVYVDVVASVGRIRRELKERSKAAKDNAKPILLTISLYK